MIWDLVVMRKRNPFVEVDYRHVKICIDEEIYPLIKTLWEDGSKHMHVVKEIQDKKGIFHLKTIPKI